MSVDKITKYPLKNLNGLSKLTVPVGSAPIGVISLKSTHEIVHVQFLEPVPREDEETEFTEIDLLAVVDDMPFSDPGDGKLLRFVGSAVWDNGHKLSHVLELVDEDEYNAEDDEWETYSEGMEPAEPPTINQADFDDLVKHVEAEEKEGE